MKDVIKLLKEKNISISVMESCTGGSVSNAITNIEGASEVFCFGAVTYSNEYKIKMGVSKEIIDKYSVYSEETVKEMSKAICKFTNSSIGIGISGKLGKIDTNNLYGKDNEVFYSIYLSNEDKYFTNKIIVNFSDRVQSKNFVIDNITKDLIKILNND